MSKAFTREDGPDEPQPAARSGPLRFTAAGLAHLQALPPGKRDALLTRVFVDRHSEPFTGLARFGSWVKVRSAGGGLVTYVLVGPEEVPVWPKGAGLPVAVAIDSPIGRALLGRRAGELAELELPRGPLELEVLEVADGPLEGA